MPEITDTRQLVERKHEIEEELEGLENEIETHPSKKDGLQQDIDELDEELQEIGDIEIATSEFASGAAMIEVHGFEDYARQYAEDVGAIDEDMRWPCNHIDWEKAAEELAGDYIEVEYQGTNYYVRG